MADRMSFDRSSSEIATSPGAAPTASGGPHSSAAQHVRLGADTQDVAKEPDQVSLAYGNVVQSDVGIMCDLHVAIDLKLSRRLA
jgi:hypothetical protein